MEHYGSVVVTESCH